jgi:type IV secretory pathway TrbD component
VQTGPLPVRPGNALDINDAADEEALRTASEEIRRFGADATLTVIEASAQQRIVSKQMISAEFGLSLYDVASKKTVWKARINLSAGTDGGMIKYSNSAHAVADAIVARLSQDGILRSCPAASKSAAPPA